MGLLLIAAPWVLGFNNNAEATYTPMIIGAGVIVYSLLTNYELGAWPEISMRTHLTLDLLGGAVLAVSPWLFGFADYVWAPHLIFGLLEMGAALMTERTPSRERGIRPSRNHGASHNATVH